MTVTLTHTTLVNFDSTSEKKLDRFEARLEGIEGILQKLSTSLDITRSGNPVHYSELHRSGQPSLSPSISGGIVPSAISEGSSAVYDDGQDDPDATAFEGPSSLAAQTVLASEFVENVVGKASLNELGPEMRSALTSLQQMVNLRQHQSSNHDARFPRQKPMPRGGIKELPMPPSQVVIAALRELKGVVKKKKKGSTQSTMCSS